MCHRSACVLWGTKHCVGTARQAIGFSIHDDAWLRVVKRRVGWARRLLRRLSWSINLQNDKTMNVSIIFSKFLKFSATKTENIFQIRSAYLLNLAELTSPLGLRRAQVTLEFICRPQSNILHKVNIFMCYDSRKRYENFFNHYLQIPFARRTSQSLFFHHRTLCIGWTAMRKL